MKQQDFEQMVEGTILQEIMNTDLNKIQDPKEEVKNTENVIGTMNNLEKRCLCLIQQKTEEMFNQIKKAVNQKILHSKLDETEFKIKMIRNLMWNLINLRLGDSNKAIRKNFKIEKITKTTTDAILSVQIMEIL